MQQEQERKGIQIAKEEIKLPLFTEGIITYVESLKEPAKKKKKNPTTNKWAWPSHIIQVPYFKNQLYFTYQQQTAKSQKFKKQCHS